MIYAHIASLNSVARRRAVELSAYDLATGPRNTEWHDTPGSTKGTERRWDAARYRYIYRDKAKGQAAPSGVAGKPRKKASRGKTAIEQIAEKRSAELERQEKGTAAGDAPAYARGRPPKEKLRSTPAETLFKQRGTSRTKGFFYKTLEEAGILTDGRFALKLTDKQRKQSAGAIARFKAAVASGAERGSPDFEKPMDFEKYLPKKYDPAPLTFSGYGQDERGVNVAVLETSEGEGIAINLQVLAEVLGRRPNATLHVPYMSPGSSEEPPIVVKDGDEVIGLIMPVLRKPEEMRRLLRRGL